MSLGGYKLAILSNGSTAMLSALVKSSGLGAYLDATISVDGTKKVKPYPDCYALIETRRQERRSHVRILQRLRRRRCQAFWLESRLDSWRQRRCPRVRSRRPKCIVFCGVTPKTLGYQHDYTVSALTDLPGIL
jgi:2-haloacid dehalogenase